MEADVDKLITGWFERARDKQLTHEECGTRLNRWHYRFGIPIIILTTGAAAATFYWLDLNDPVKMGIGIASGLAALLACMQTFLGLAHRADQHRIACARYGALRRSLEILKTFTPSDPIDLRRSITDIQRQMDRLAETSPVVSMRVKKKIDKELEGRSRVISLLNDSTSQRLNVSRDRKPAPAPDESDEHATAEAARVA
jgi:hypothetical protein